jgi:hypothetical protein
VSWDEGKSYRVTLCHVKRKTYGGFQIYESYGGPGGRFPTFIEGLRLEKAVGPRYNTEPAARGGLENLGKSCGPPSEISLKKSNDRGKKRDRVTGLC